MRAGSRKGMRAGSRKGKKTYKRRRGGSSNAKAAPLGPSSTELHEDYKATEDEQRELLNKLINIAIRDNNKKELNKVITAAVKFNKRSLTNNDFQTVDITKAKQAKVNIAVHENNVNLVVNMLHEPEVFVGDFDTPEVMAALLAVEGVDLNMWKDSDGKTALIIAAEEGYMNVVKLLLDVDGVDPNIADEDGKTALIHAAHEGHAQVVTLLLEKGADVNAMDAVDYRSNWTALMHATAGAHAEVVKLLLARNDLPNDQKTRAYNLTSSYNNRDKIPVMRKLLKKWAPPDYFFSSTRFKSSAYR